jgi:hypothetical protein
MAVVYHFFAKWIVGDDPFIHEAIIGQSATAQLRLAVYQEFVIWQSTTAKLQGTIIVH